MKMGLIGFAGSGKTTVFNSLTGQHAATGGFSAGSGRMNVAVIKVPDTRVDALAKMFSPRKTTFAEIQFADLPPGSPDGTKEGLDSGMLAQIRDLEALTLVLRDFENPAVDAPADAKRDLRAMETELLLGDLTVIEKRLERLAKEKGKEKEAELLGRLRVHLEAGRALRLMALTPEEEHALSGFRFLSQKPLLVVRNTTEAGLTRDDAALAAECSERGAGFMTMSAAIESEIAELDAAGQAEFLSSLGLEQSARDRFIREAFRMLHLISFLTAGEDECRAWPIVNGTTAVRAAGRIHSDIERGFIRAEVMSFEDLMRLGSEAACRAAGKFALQGKDYVMRDGDVVHFRFNV